jgi:integrase
VLHSALEFAVEQCELSANLLGTVGWRPPKIADVLDRRVVVNPMQARELITAVSYVGAVDRGRHLMTFVAVLYFAGLRPSEAIGLTQSDCDLPDEGWGHLTVTTRRPLTNRRWTDTGESHDVRGLKHRPATAR